MSKAKCSGCAALEMRVNLLSEAIERLKDKVSILNNRTIDLVKVGFFDE